MLVEKNSALLEDVASMKKPWIASHGLDRNHFDMHNFGHNDALFDNTVKLVLDKITSSFKALTPDELLHTFTPDENCLWIFLHSFSYKC